VATNGATDTQIVSGANGSGSYLPLSFYTNNDIRFQMGNAGQLNVRTAPGTVSSGTSGQVLTSGGPAAGVSWTTISTGGQLQTQVFTAPGTFTTPASTTQVRVTVVGGGGGGSGPGSPAAGDSGGSSSFGALVSATGGGGAPNGPASPASPGTGTVSSGTTIVNSNVGRSPSTGQTYVSGAFVGGLASIGNSGVAYSTTNRDRGAGAAASGGSQGGAGGLAVAVAPVTVSTPYAITVGSGGPSPGPSNNAGIGGVVVVEFVG
jgi:hypothetical protein